MRRRFRVLCSLFLVLGLGAEMTQLDGDLFAVVDEQEAGAVEALPAVVEDGGDEVGDVVESSEPWFAVTVLTLPNTSVWPVPAEFVADKVEVDLSELAAKSMAETRSLITETLPDQQLEQINEAELARDKPRQAVLKAIHAERERRGPAFANWVKKMSENPLTCRIAGIAWGTVVDGVARDIRSYAVRSAADEWTVLECLWMAFRAFKPPTDRLYPVVASWDLQAVFDIVNARCAGVGCDGPWKGSFFGPCYREHGGDWVARGQQVGGLIGVAQGFGIEHSQVPYVPELMELFCAEPGSTQVADWAAQKLMLEVDLLKIVSRFS